MTKTPFDIMLEQAQALTKGFPAMEAFSPKAFEAMWPTMPKDVMEMMFGNTLNDGGLDAKTRLMLTLAGMTMQGAQNEVGVRSSVRHLAEVGASEKEIYEAIGMMSVFAGLPASTRAMELARDVLEDGKANE
ncbi:MAG: carboxymuconolactone decarboxylase family protein [Pseudomonadota bacterium]